MSAFSLLFVAILPNFVLFLFSAVGPSHSPSLPPPVPSSGYQGAPGIFSFSPANMICAVKQKSAFNPVVRPPGSGESPPAAVTIPTGLASGWAHPILNVSIFAISKAK